MPNIKQISDRRNYMVVLRNIAVGEPVFLTENGRGKFAEGTSQCSLLRNRIKAMDISKGLIEDQLNLME